MDNILGYACGLGAGDPGCADGPRLLFEKYSFEKSCLLSPAFMPDKYQAIAEICTSLAQETEKRVLANQFFHVIAGDHSSAIGTWSGVANALGKENPLGLIWIDAHLDSHTPQTSPTGNIHGMPVAALLGHGHPALSLSTFPVIQPENLCLIGIRSYEPKELELLNQLQVKIYFMDEIHRRGLDAVFKEAHHRISQNTKAWGLSLDLDGLDPDFAPAVGTPVENGIALEDLMDVLIKYAFPDKHQGTLKGFEITEFNPHRDKDQITENLILTLMDIV